MDVVFVVDDSGSMAGAQAKLKANFPRMVNTLNAFKTKSGAGGTEGPDSASRSRLSAISGLLCPWPPSILDRHRPDRPSSPLIPLPRLQCPAAGVMIRPLRP
jgi:hypothetical protein